MRVLLIDDDPRFRQFTREGLEGSGIECHAVSDADAGHQALASGVVWDVILLDVMMPRVDGWSFLTRLRAEGQRTPIIFVSARAAIDERVKGLRLGADDYIVKPFAFAELIARIETVARRSASPTSLRHGQLELDLKRGRAACGERRINLSPLEFNVLRVLLESRGTPVSRNGLLQQVWDRSIDSGTNIVEVAMGRLRRKLPIDHGVHIDTVRGEGYRLRPLPREA